MIRLAVTAAALAAACLVLWRTTPARDSVVAETAAAVGREIEREEGSGAPSIAGDAACRTGLAEALGVDEPSPDAETDAFACETAGGAVRVTDGTGAEVGSRPLPDWTSLLPPLVAVFLALGTRRLLPSLLAGVWLGAFLLDPAWGGLPRLVLGVLWPVLADSFSLSILMFTFALVGMVNVASRAAGNVGIANAVSRWARGPRGASTATGVLGVCIFFDDYANSQVLGNTMRPLTDRFRISREKLAFLVDATAAPVSGLAVLSTWIGYEVGLLSAATAAAGLESTGYDFFFRMLPFRFYCMCALAFVFLVSAWRRDFGPMLAAERRAALRGELSRPGAVLLADVEADRVAAHPGIRPNAWVAGIPVLFVVVAILGGLVGFGAASPATAEWLAEDPGRSIASFAGLRQCFGEADSAFVLLLASLVGSFVAAALALTRRTVPGAEGSSRTASRDLGLLAAAFAGLAAVSLLAFGGLLREEHPPWTAAYWASATEGPALAALAAVLVGGLVLVAALLGLRMAAERRAGRAIHALSLSDVGGAWMAGARSMALAAGILILAWSIQQVCKDLGTGIYMVAALRGAFDPGWLPAATFLAAAAIAFATGTSWATMGILIPTVLPLAHRLGGEELAVIATAAVLDGAIFGDHCSPISDTTVLSSIASRCDHLDHVRTQLPYAATCMIAALVAGYLPSAFGYHGPLCYVAALGMLALALWGIGRRVPDPPVGTGQ